MRKATIYRFTYIKQKKKIETYNAIKRLGLPKSEHITIFAITLMYNYNTYFNCIAQNRQQYIF